MQTFLQHEYGLLLPCRTDVDFNKTILVTFKGSQFWIFRSSDIVVLRADELMLLQLLFGSVLLADISDLSG